MTGNAPEGTSEIQRLVIGRALRAAANTEHSTSA